MFYCLSLGYTVSRRDVLPRSRTVLCLQGVPERQTCDQTVAQDSSSSPDDASLHSSSEHLSADSSASDHQRAFLHQDSPKPGMSCEMCVPLESSVSIFSFSRKIILFFFAYAEESLLSAAHPLQNDANQDSTETKDTDDKVGSYSV